MGGFGKAGKRSGLILHVLGNIDEHRSGAARCGNAEGSGNDVEQFNRRVHQKIVFGHWHAHPVDIDFLKGIRANHGGWHLAGNKDDGNGVEAGIGNGGEQVGGAGAGGAEAHGGLAADAGHALGDKPGALFVPGQDMANHLALGQGVVEWQICTAGNAGDGSHALTFEQADNQLGSGHRDHRAISLRDRIDVARRLTRRGARKAKPPPVAPAGVEMLKLIPSLPLRRVGYEYKAYYEEYAYRDEIGR